MNRKVKHGMSGTPEQHAWINAKRRCNNSKIPGFHRYGARGIKMSPLWENDFAAFLQEVGRRPSPLHSLDRIDNNKGYEPGNVRWATAEQQAQNTATCRKITHLGRTQTMSEWARELNLHPHTIHGRLKKGWPISQVLSQEKRQSGSPRRELIFQGKVMSLAAWAREVGLTAGTLRRRLKLGWSVERALTEPLPPVTR